MAEIPINETSGALVDLPENFFRLKKLGDTGPISVGTATDTGVGPPIKRTAVSGNDEDDINLEIMPLFQHDPQLVFDRNLTRSFEADPIDSGYTHICESILGSSLQEYGSVAVEWIQHTYVRNIRRVAHSSDILRCVGRLPTGLVEPWGLTMAIAGLSHPDVRVRDAAVCALENWATQDSFEILSLHQEPVSWLANHIDQILDDVFES